MNFLDLKFWPKVIFSVYARHRDFIGLRKKNRFFWVVKKALGDFFGYAIKSSDFLDRQILKLGFFLV